MEATFDPSRQLDLYFRVNRAGSKVLNFFDSNGSAYTINGNTFQFLLKDHLGNGILTLTSGNGLTIGTSSVTIAVTANQTNIAPAGYVWELYLSNLGKTWLSGNAYFHTGVFDGVTSTSSITISDADTVSVTVTDSLGSPATQSEVNTGTATGVYVSPSTLANSTQWATKQDALVSGTNIKTINGASVLGSGDLTVSGGGVSGLTATRIPYAQNATTLVDSANLTWDNTNAILSVGSQRLFTQGTNGTHGHYIGYLAGTTNAFTTSDGRNTAFGYRALRSLAPAGGATDSSYNTAVGWDAGQAITTGRYNTVMGHTCGDAITTGIFNTAYGNGALSAVSTQNSNTAVGYNAMGSATCTESVAIGHTAANVLTGGRCVAIGWGALAKTTSGNYNIAIGSESLQENVTGQGNVAIGFYSGVYAKGGDNVFVGNYACGQATVTTTALDGNVMIGAGAGNTDTPANRSTNHNYSTFIGYQSGLGSTTQCSYATAIGYRAKVYQDRSMVFGSEVDADRVNYGFGGEGYGSGQGVLYIKNAVTNASAAGTNGIIIHAKDASTGSANSTLALYLEEAPEATATFTQTHRLKVWINGVEYYLSLDAV